MAVPSPPPTGFSVRRSALRWLLLARDPIWIAALQNGIVLTTAYFADASSGWGTGGSATIAGDFGFLAKRCCTRSR
jgi:hypothetical protein